MDYKEIMAAIGKKEYVPVYLLTGVEPYFIDKISHAIDFKFFKDESERDFNYQLLYGKDTTVAEVVSAAKQYPMMASHRLVVLREAQSLSKIEQLAEYAKNPQKQTVLVLCYKHQVLKATTSLYKAIDKNGIIFKSPVVYDNQLPNYIKDIVKEKKFKIDAEAVSLLAAHLGTDLSRIDNELEKLNNILAPNAEITCDIIENYIGISKEYNNYEFVNAVLSRNEEKAYNILNYFASDNSSNRKALISSLFYAFFTLLQYQYSLDKSRAFLQSMQLNFSVIPIYQAAAGYFSVNKLFRIIHLLKRYDLMNKGASGAKVEECELVKELIFKIFKT